MITDEEYRKELQRQIDRKHQFEREVKKLMIQNRKENIQQTERAQ
jgi:hypothetical protein